MRKKIEKQLEAAGWKSGTADEFLGLDEAESSYLDLRERLAGYLRVLRLKRGMTQQAVAKLAGSSQSRVAKMETGDPSISLDLLVRTLLSLGATAKDLGKVLSSPKKKIAA